jgi:polysaccharide biosynthesis protein VpsQ
LKARLITILFIVFIVFIVALANAGLVYKAFPFITSMPGQDKTGHFVLMGSMAFLANFSLGGRRVRVWCIRPYSGSLIVLIFVIVEECSQFFIMTRTFGLGDLAADILGILVLGNIGGVLGQKLPPR